MLVQFFLLIDCYLEFNIFIRSLWSPGPTSYKLSIIDTNSGPRLQYNLVKLQILKTSQFYFWIGGWILLIFGPSYNTDLPFTCVVGVDNSQYALEVEFALPVLADAVSDWDQAWFELFRCQAACKTKWLQYVLQYIIIFQLCHWKITNFQGIYE